MISNEQYERLKPYVAHLRRGLNDYCYGLFQKDFDILLELYKELGGKERLRYSCNVCCLRLCKFLAKLYFEFEKQLTETKEEVKEEKKKRKTKKKEVE